MLLISPTPQRDVNLFSYLVQQYKYSRLKMVDIFLKKTILFIYSISIAAHLRQVTLGNKQS